MGNPQPRRRKLQNPVTAFIDWFVPPNSTVDRAQIRERVLAGYVLLQFIVGACASIAMLMSSWPWESRWVAAAIASGQSAINLLLLYALKCGARRSYVVNGVIGLCYVIFTGAIVFTGGAYATDIPLLLILVACFAFCLGGERLGLAWTILILLTLLIIDQLHLQPREGSRFNKEGLRQLSSVVFMATLIMLGAILLIYERVYSRYGRQITSERQNYYAQAHTDTLTGLPNRRAFELALQENLHTANSLNQLMTLIYIDLDGFKGVNDRFGHDVGDLLLKEVARRIESCLRATDRGARLGGDEFGVILGGLVDVAQAGKIIERLRTALAAPVLHEGMELPFGASIGHATFPLDAQDSATLVHAADQMMYQEKKTASIPGAAKNQDKPENQGQTTF